MSKLGKAGAVALFMVAVPGAMLLLAALAPLIFAVLFAAELWWHGSLARAWREAVDLVTPDRWN